jgi:AAA+ ATPase superfamily predicted ATPase
MKPCRPSSVELPKPPTMADLSKIQRSKDLIAELLNYLKNSSKKDKKTMAFINELQLSMQLIDNKMEKFKR